MNNAWNHLSVDYYRERSRQRRRRRGQILAALAYAFTVLNLSALPYGWIGTITLNCLIAWYLVRRLLKNHRDERQREAEKRKRAVELAERLAEEEAREAVGRAEREARRDALRAVEDALKAVDRDQIQAVKDQLAGSLSDEDAARTQAELDNRRARATLARDVALADLGWTDPPRLFVTGRKSGEQG